LTAPIWVKLTRNGAYFSGYYSPDGKSWTLVTNPQAITVTTTMLGGVAACAHNNSELNTSTLANVSVTSAGLPMGWADTDIGSPSDAGSASYSGGQWTVAGGGADIWGASDQFNLASKDFNGYGSIVAEVLSLQNTDPATGWSKAGVMLRNDATANAVNAAVF